MDIEEKTEFKFDELEDKAKDRVREKYRVDGHDPDWYEFVIEDAVHHGALMGIEISKTHHAPTRPGRKGYETADIFFSGFCCQGDGASFRGEYGFKPDAVEKITAETKDEELLRIAQELTLISVTRKLQALSSFSVSVTTSGSYSHSNTMRIELNFDEDDREDVEPSVEELEAEVLQLMRDFADWIYKRLDDENDYLNSDEYVDAQLNEINDVYDEDGDRI